MKRAVIRTGFLGLACMAAMTPAIAPQQGFSQVKIGVGSSG